MPNKWMFIIGIGLASITAVILIVVMNKKEEVANKKSDVEVFDINYTEGTNNGFDVNKKEKEELNLPKPSEEAIERHEARENKDTDMYQKLNTRTEQEQSDFMDEDSKVAVEKVAKEIYTFDNDSPTEHFTNTIRTGRLTRELADVLHTEVMRVKGDKDGVSEFLENNKYVSGNEDDGSHSHEIADDTGLDVIKIDYFNEINKGVSERVVKSMKVHQVDIPKIDGFRNDNREYEITLITEELKNGKASTVEYEAIIYANNSNIGEMWVSKIKGITEDDAKKDGNEED